MPETKTDTCQHPTIPGLPAVCVDLVRWIDDWKRAHNFTAAPLAELPAHLQDPDILHEAESGGVVSRFVTMWGGVRLDVSAEVQNWLRRVRLAVADASAKPVTPDGPRGDEKTLAEWAEKYDVPKTAWTRATKRKPNEPGYLPHIRRGRNVYVSPPYAKHFAETEKAKREAKQIHPLCVRERN